MARVISSWVLSIDFILRHQNDAIKIKLNNEYEIKIKNNNNKYILTLV